MTISKFWEPFGIHKTFRRRRFSETLWVTPKSSAVAFELEQKAKGKEVKELPARSLSDKVVWFEVT